MKEIKIAILGNITTNFIAKDLSEIISKQYKVTIYEADYDSIEQEVLDTSSGLFQFSPDYIILLFSHQKLLQQFYKDDTSLVDSFLSKIESFLFSLKQSLTCKIIINNFISSLDPIFGNYGLKVESSFASQISKINYQIELLSREIPSLHILDIRGIQNRLSFEEAFDNRMFYKASLPFSLSFQSQLSKHISDIIFSFLGHFKKCVILDLDNTLWGGIIGDDGIENIEIGNLGLGTAFTDIQLWAKALQKRGIILCVCSKNTEHIAKSPFIDHPEMVLCLEDIAVFTANWENKADNIRHIQKVLNIGFDSMVFIDDNPFEREQVKSELPEVLVPDLPEDPSDYLDYLLSLNLFETVSFSIEDKDRTKKYQEENKRLKLKQNFSSIDTYLESLNMKAVLESFNNFNIPRIAQLFQRSNQFNLRTIRYSEIDLLDMKPDEHLTLSIKLSDKFGNYGLIGVFVGRFQEGRKLFIENWVMSCRVLKRGVELFLLNSLVEETKKKGVKEIIGEYLPTPKNGLVKDHYKELGFSHQNGKWHLKTDEFRPKKHFINI